MLFGMQRPMSIKCYYCYWNSGSPADYCTAGSFVAHLRNAHSVYIHRDWNREWRCDTCANGGCIPNEESLRLHLKSTHNVCTGPVQPTEECRMLKDYEPPASMSVKEFPNHLSFIQQMLSRIDACTRFVLKAAPFIVHSDFVDVHSDFVDDDKPAQMLQQVLIRFDPDIVQLILDYAWDGMYYRGRRACLLPHVTVSTSVFVSPAL